MKPCPRAEQQRAEKEFATKLGPKSVILDELENLYLPVPFDHAGHAEMGQMTGGCAICHHYTPEGSAHPACKTCHDARPGAGDIRKPGLKGAYHRQCLSCHREWSGETGCSACHRPKTGPHRASSKQLAPTVDDLVGRMHPPIPEPDVKTYETTREGYPDTRVQFRHRQHVQGYGLRCAECHREDNCNRCHNPSTNHVVKVRSIDEHHKPCIQCHRTDTDTHTDTHTDTCERCHYETGKSPPPIFDHGRTGWPLANHHRDAGCRQCHACVPFTKLDRSCDACHKNWSPATFNHAITGQALDENHLRADCDACHVDRRFDRPPTCDGCHEEGENITFPARRPGQWNPPEPNPSPPTP